MNDNEIPKTIAGLYAFLCVMSGRHGTVQLTADNSVFWQFTPDLSFGIWYDDMQDEGHVSVNNGQTHWHPEWEEIGGELYDINSGNDVFMVKKLFEEEYLINITREAYELAHEAYERKSRWLKKTIPAASFGRM